MNYLKFSLCALSLISSSILALDNDEVAFSLFRKSPPETTAQLDKPQPIEAPKPKDHCHSFLVGGDVALAYDYFRSLPDGSWTGNNGAFGSLNLAVAIPKQCQGFGLQLGGSYGLYDWEGRGSTITGNTKALQQQAFITTGFFRQTPHRCGLNAALVYDVMFNKEFGVFALNPILGQVRGQLGYLIRGGNEVGLWGSIDTQTSHKITAQIPVQFRAISQINLFWTHYFKNSAQTSLWVGTPYRRGLMHASGRAGNYIVGANFKAPLTQSLSIIGHGLYMGARSGSVFQESSNYAANITFGVNYSFGGRCAGQRPYLPLADNSNFLVDTNLNE